MKTMKILGNRNLFLLVSVAVALTFGVYGPANADDHGWLHGGFAVMV